MTAQPDDHDQEKYSRFKKVYDFNRQLARGEAAEKLLDELIHQETPWYPLAVTDLEVQRRGIDRILLDKPAQGVADSLFTIASSGGFLKSAEYKADFTGARTHNCFVEMISVREQNKLGWAYTSQADLLVHWLPQPTSLAYVIPFEELRRNLDTWRELYPSRNIPNGENNQHRYTTTGLLVPQAEFEELAIRILDSSEIEDRQEFRL